MSVRLRLVVPALWVLTISLTLAAASTPLPVPQFWSADPHCAIQSMNTEVVKDSSAHPVDQCTLTEVSCGYVKMVNYLSSEQKLVIIILNLTLNF